MFYMSLNAIIKFIVRDFPKNTNTCTCMSDKIQFSDTFAYKGAIHTCAYLFILINDFKII